MSDKALRKAARLSDLPDIESHVMMMLMADRADDDGHLFAQETELVTELTAELNAVIARLRGNPLVRAGVDNARVTRVVEALRDVEDEQP